MQCLLIRPSKKHKSQAQPHETLGRKRFFIVIVEGIVYCVVSPRKLLFPEVRNVHRLTNMSSELDMSNVHRLTNISSDTDMRTVLPFCLKDFMRTFCLL
jgi:hypothetical protein